MSAPASPHRSITHLPALDGLRGLAVLGVVFFHSGAMLKGGYLGVDLFFVLSGFLITSILLAEHARAGRIQLGAFWVRRARRLFPALLGLMPAVAIYARVFAQPDELAGLRGDALATLAYVANWRAVFSHKSYWELFAAPSPLEHTWSLAIEEQFYVVWPLLVVGVLVVLRRSVRVLLAVTLLLTAGSVAAMLFLYAPDSTSRAYYGTDTRAAAIFVGAALAMVMGPEPKLGPRARRWLDPLGVVAVVGLGFAWARLDGQDPFLYRAGFWLTELACLVLILCALAPGSFVARALSVRPLTYAGSISYGIYLWHWPIDCVLVPERVHIGPLALLALRLASTLAIAMVSYRWLEQPIRARGLPFGKPFVVVPASFALAACVVVVGTRARPSARPQPLPLSSVSVAAPPGNWPTPYSVDSRTLPPASELPPHTLRILTLGDSVSGKLGVALRYRQDEAHAFVAERGVGNCSILQSLTITNLQNGPPTDAGGCAAKWVADVTELRPDVTFIVLGGGYFARMEIDGKKQDSCQPGWHAAYRARLESLAADMQPFTGRIVLMLAPYPMGRWRSEGLLERVDCFNAILTEVARARNFATVDLATHLCPTRDCILLSQGEPVRPDGLHPDGVGAEEIARWTLGELRRVDDTDASR